MEITPQSCKEESGLSQHSESQTLAVAFVQEKTIAGQESDLQSPAQVYLKEEISEETKSDIEPSTDVFLKKEFAEVKSVTKKFTMREEAAEVKDEINQGHVSSHCALEDNNLR
jgi:N-acetyl-anhydromuramyl-L-alanine amidase AmpD